ncbi:MAG: carboxymuconolactone decarboxylase family protein [Kordiimonadaceae bacterium]|jgi:uncharacterized peroxidase-related enzyme|nr:carboxymuconolactone decarboxylase family protein [Kordiimonadaceae bacterium]MBT6032052.1 carboxymuconolactone decarboxylase family protein [Kordiimonadaceae bacterium]
MSLFKIHTAISAAPQLRLLFEEVEQNVSFVPNIFAVVAESEQALKAYEAMGRHLSSCPFTPSEKETIELVTSIENGCSYCVAGHSAFAAMQDVPDEIISSLRQNKPIDDPRLQALAEFTRKLIRSKGKISNRDFILFFDAGFTKAQMMDVVLGISLKTFTNYISNAVSLPLDPQFQPYAWSGPEKTEFNEDQFLINQL